MAVLRTRMVDLKVSEEGAQGFLAQPDDESKHPGVVLIQEWWGLEPHIKDLAHKLAAEGFIVLVPDLYNGKIATEPDEAGKMIMMIRGNVERALAYVQGAIDTLKEMPAVEPKKVGVIGFCVGGFVTYKIAERSADVAAAVPFYGAGYDPSSEDVARVQAPILAFYGDQDESIPLEQVEKIRRLCQEAGKDYESRVYHAGHAFVNPAHGMGDEKAARDAWPKAVAFLKEHLT
jgi:carboxymethylenebutenolidase